MSTAWSYAHTKTGRARGTGLGYAVPKGTGGAKMNKDLEDLEKRTLMYRPMTQKERKIAYANPHKANWILRNFDKFHSEVPSEVIEWCFEKLFNINQGKI